MIGNVKDDALRLLDLLRNGEPHRQVYRGDGTTQWFVTYGGGEWSPHAVQDLVRAGKIVPAYSNCQDAYHVGRTIDIDRTMAERKKNPGRKDALVYVGD